MHLETRVQQLPDKAGVYIMKDERGDVIYVGKAASIKKRLRSYFTGKRNQTPKVQSLVKRIDDFEYIITDNEVEALILELNLIKKYKPKYNVVFRDDKSYPYLKVTLNEKWPRIIVTRNMRRDGSRYFGPYTKAGALHDTVRLLRRLFPIRACKHSELQVKDRACLNVHIKRCMAPCVGNVSEEKYNEMVKEIILFMEGKQEHLLQRLKDKMAEAAENLDFERAAEIRDQINSVESVFEKQKIESAGGDDQDVIALVRDGDEASVQQFYIRGGKLMGRNNFFFDRVGEIDNVEIMSIFMKQYYARAAEIPNRIIMSADSNDRKTIEEWLRKRKGRKAALHVPKRGEKLQLIEMAQNNARMELQRYQEELRKKEMITQEALLELQNYLELENPPFRIECYDVSNISGTNSVGSMVVFESGQPKNSDYRRFRIKNVEGPDDYASLYEVLYRRLRNIRKRNNDNGFSALPDLIIIDGGKGQLNAARQAMLDLKIDSIPVFGLAKKEEEVFSAGSKEAVSLPHDSNAHFLLQRVRDEAHRYAVSYHRHLRGTQIRSSVLDEIPGIGPKRKRELLRHFGSVENLKKASLEEISKVNGMNRNAAQKVIEHIH